MNALISVSDKTGIIELAQALHGLGIGHDKSHIGRDRADIGDAGEGRPRDTRQIVRIRHATVRSRREVGHGKLAISPYGAGFGLARRARARVKEDRLCHSPAVLPDLPSLIQT